MSQLRQAKKLADYQSPSYTVSQIELTFELDPQATKVTALSQFKRQAALAEPLVLDGQHLQLVGIWLNDVAVTSYQLTDGQLVIPVVPAEFTLKIITLIAPAANTALEGLYLSNGAYCTQCEAEGFRAITFYPDRPDVLAVFTTHLIAFAEQFPQMLSNGNHIGSELLADGRLKVSWHDPFPKPCYLFALVAGDFDTLEDQYITRSGREVTLAFYVDKGQRQRARFAMDALKRAMQFDEQHFDLEYDLDIYMVVAVDFFNMGAMENKGLNIFNSKFVLADDQTATDHDYFLIESIIGHEYFHNWTGNRVTCRDWFQLSLKEGLTVFRDQQFSSAMASATLSRIDAIQTIRTAQFAEDASPMAHPIRPEQVLEMNNFYTVTVYDKGAEVIRMLHTLLGEAGFRRGMALYFARHDGQAVTCDDFVQAMQDANHHDLTQFKRWYQQAGTPVVTVQTSYCSQSQQLHVDVTQHTPATADGSPKQPLVIPLKTELISADECFHQQLLFTVTDAKQSFCVDQVPPSAQLVTLADFSAPVKLVQHRTVTELLFAVRYAQDGVARWDAMQSLWGDLVKQAMLAASQQQSFVLPIELTDLFRQLLIQPLADQAFCAELMTLPTYDIFAEQFDPIPVAGILLTLQDFRQQIASTLAPVFAECYRALPTVSYIYHADQVGRRRLQSLCLSYLALQPAYDDLLLQHYQQADNMTDRLSVLHALVAAEPLRIHPLTDILLQSLYDVYAQDVLVFDKWAMLQVSRATEQVFARIQQVIACPQFSLSNPNRVRAVYGAFSRLNPAQFHREDGQGYQLLAEIVGILDQRNPQLAARLITPLLSWRRFPAQQQGMMKRQLEMLKANTAISNDVFEKVERSLS
jgi:aminopeptidase N